jgi:hypothetical protein
MHAYRLANIRIPVYGVLFSRLEWIGDIGFEQFLGFESHSRVKMGEISQPA